MRYHRPSGRSLHLHTSSTLPSDRITAGRGLPSGTDRGGSRDAGYRFTDGAGPGGRAGCHRDVAPGSTGAARPVRSPAQTHRRPGRAPRGDRRGGGTDRCHRPSLLDTRPAAARRAVPRPDVRRALRRGVRRSAPVRRGVRPGGRRTRPADRPVPRGEPRSGVRRRGRLGLPAGLLRRRRTGAAAGLGDRRHRGPRRVGLLCGEPAARPGPRHRRGTTGHRSHPAPRAGRHQLGAGFRRARRRRRSDRPARRAESRARHRNGQRRGVRHLRNGHRKRPGRLPHADPGDQERRADHAGHRGRGGRLGGRARRARDHHEPGWDLLVQHAACAAPGGAGRRHRARGRGQLRRAVVWPARFDECIAVAGVDARGAKWRGSCSGSAVDVSAPAQNVWRAAVPNGRRPQPGHQLRRGADRGCGRALAGPPRAGEPRRCGESPRRDAAGHVPADGRRDRAPAGRVGLLRDGRRDRGRARPAGGGPGRGPRPGERLRPPIRGWRPR